MRVVEQLHAAGEHVIVIDDDPDPPLLRLVISWGVTHLAGSGRRPTTLAAAGISNARCSRGVAGVR